MCARPDSSAGGGWGEGGEGHESQRAYGGKNHQCVSRQLRVIKFHGLLKREVTHYQGGNSYIPEGRKLRQTESNMFNELYMPRGIDL